MCVYQLTCIQIHFSQQFTGEREVGAVSEVECKSETSSLLSLVVTLALTQ